MPDGAFTLSALLFPMERSDFERLKGAGGTDFFVIPSGVVSDKIHTSLNAMPEGRKDGREQRIGRGKGNKMIRSPFYCQYSTDDSTKVDRRRF